MPIQPFKLDYMAPPPSKFHQALSSALETYGGINKAALDPYKTWAEAQAKMTYANLMGPQFIAKMLGNPDIAANWPGGHPEKSVERIVTAGGGTAQPNPQQGGTWWDTVRSGLSNMFNPTQAQTQQQPTAENPNPEPDWNAPENNAPAAPATHAISQPAPVDNNPYPDEPKETLDQWQNRKMAERNAQAAPIAQPQQSVPQPAASIPAPVIPPAASYEEKAGRFSGIKKEGEEAGKLRAQDVQALNDKIEIAQQKQLTYDETAKLLADPEFENMRQLSLAGNYELAYFAREGTPAQKALVGKFTALSNTMIKDGAQDFKGQFRVGEQQLLQNTKVNPGDTVDVMRGKLMAASSMNKFLTERMKLTSQIMEKQHVSKRLAMDAADHIMQGNKLREQIEDSMYPPIHVKNKKT